jgi:hypothetical protein
MITQEKSRARRSRLSSGLPNGSAATLPTDDQSSVSSASSRFFSSASSAFLLED